MVLLASYFMVYWVRYVCDAIARIYQLSLNNSHKPLHLLFECVRYLRNSKFLSVKWMQLYCVCIYCCHIFSSLSTHFASNYFFDPRMAIVSKNIEAWVLLKPWQRAVMRDTLETRLSLRLLKELLEQLLTRARYWGSFLIRCKLSSKDSRTWVHPPCNQPMTFYDQNLFD
jgi:hypothetical protein